MIRKWMSGDMEVAVNDQSVVNFNNDFWLCRGRIGSGPIEDGQKYVIARVRPGMSDSAIERTLRHKFVAGEVYEITDSSTPVAAYTTLPVTLDEDPEGEAMG